MSYNPFMNANGFYYPPPMNGYMPPVSEPRYTGPFTSSVRNPTNYYYCNGERDPRVNVANNHPSASFRNEPPNNQPPQTIVNQRPPLPVNVFPTQPNRAPKQPEISRSNVNVAAQNLRLIASLTNAEHNKKQKDLKNVYEKLTSENLILIKDSFCRQIKEMNEEREKKDREIAELTRKRNELNSMIKYSEEYFSDICQAVLVATKRPPASNSTAQLPPGLISGARINPAQKNAAAVARQRNYAEQQRLNNPPPAPNTNKVPPNKRLRFDSPPQNATNSSYNAPCTNNQPRVQNNQHQVHYQQQQRPQSNDLRHSASSRSHQPSQHQLRINLQSATNHLQSATMTPSPVSNEELFGGPYSGSDEENVDSNEEKSMKFTDYYLKFTVSRVIIPAQLLDIKGGKPPVTMKIRLSEAQIHNIKTKSSEYRIILRMGRPELSQKLYQDYLSTKVKIRVNNNRPLFPGEKKTNNPQQKAKKCDYIEAPMDITEQCINGLNSEITFDVDQGNDIKVVVGVYYVQLLNFAKAFIAFNNKKSNLTRPKEMGKKIINDLLKESTIIDDVFTLPLVCPLSKQRIIIPCIGNQCTHPKAFDFQAMFDTYKKTFLWKCPICDKVIKSGQLILDGLLLDLLQETNDECLEVKFHKNGNWIPVENKKKSLNLDSSADICIISDDES